MSRGGKCGPELSGGDPWGRVFVEPFHGRRGAPVVSKWFGGPMSLIPGNDLARVLREVHGVGAGPRPIGGTRDLISMELLSGRHPRSIQDLLSCCATLARLHRLDPRRCSPVALPNVADMVRAFFMGLPQDFVTDLGLRPAMDHSLEVFTSGSLSGRQRLVHMDCNLTNWLVGPDVPRLVDWNSVCLGHPAVDFAYLSWEVGRRFSSFAARLITAEALLRRYCDAPALRDALGWISLVQGIAIRAARRGIPPFAQYAKKQADMLPEDRQGWEEACGA